MAGLRGNQAYFVAAKQVSKGTAVTKWEDKYFFSGGNLGPTHQTDQLAETDNTRNAGDQFVTQTATEGNPETYIRDASIHHLLEYALGAAEHSGATNFVHKMAPSAALPYITMGRAIGGTLFEQYQDCKVDELALSWATGSPGTAALSVQGLKALRLAAEWSAESAPPTAATAAPLNYNQALVKLGGAETRLISSFDCSFSNNLELQQTDDSVPYDVVEGQFAVTMGFDLIFEDLKEYNKFHYGGEAGTEQSASIFTTSLSVELKAGTNNYLVLTFPAIAYQEFPVEPDPGGGPVTVSVRGASQRHAEGFVKAEVKNQVEK